MTLPVVAPDGTTAVMLVEVQLLVVAVTPLNVTELPVLVPNVVPEMVTQVPTIPEVGDKLVMCGITVKATPLLATPETVTTTFPVVAAVGTVTLIVVEFQLLKLAVVPLNLTLLPELVPKPVPVITTAVPTGPAVTERLTMLGAAAVSWAALIPKRLKEKTTRNLIVRNFIELLPELQLQSNKPRLSSEHTLKLDEQFELLRIGDCYCIDAIRLRSSQSTTFTVVGVGFEYFALRIRDRSDERICVIGKSCG
jgi:hypothetical protein